MGREAVDMVWDLTGKLLENQNKSLVETHTMSYKDIGIKVNEQIDSLPEENNQRVKGISSELMEKWQSNFDYKSEEYPTNCIVTVKRIENTVALKLAIGLNYLQFYLDKTKTNPFPIGLRISHSKSDMKDDLLRQPRNEFNSDNIQLIERALIMGIFVQAVNEVVVAKEQAN